MGVERTKREPAFNLPAILTFTILLLLGIQAARALLSDETEFRLVVEGGFIPGPWSVAAGFADAPALVEAAGEGATDPAAAAARGEFAAYLAQAGRPGLWTWLTYGLLHGSWIHAGLNCVWLAAFGSPVVRRVGAFRSVVLALAAGLGGSLAHWGANPLSVQPMIGASASVSGFMAAAATFVFNRRFGDPLFDHPETRERASVAGILRNRSALMFLGSWLVINLATGLLAQPLGLVETGIAWEAHIGGLAVGLLLFPALDRAKAEPPRH